MYFFHTTAQHYSTFFLHYTTILHYERCAWLTLQSLVLFFVFLPFLEQFEGKDGFYFISIGKY